MTLEEDFMIKTNAPASVHIQVISTGEEQNGVMMSLVNHTGTMYRPVHQLVSVHQIEVDIKVPHSPKELRILKAESPVVFKETRNDNGTVTIKFVLDRLDEFAAVWMKM